MKSAKAFFKADSKGDDASTAEEGQSVSLPTQDDEDYVDPYTITEEVLAKRLEKRYKGRFITQFYAGALASIGSIIFGISLGWSSPAFAVVSHEVKSVELHYHFSWIASMVPLGVCIGVMWWSYLNSKFGPRKMLLIQFVFLALIWVTLATTHTSKEVYMTCRFFCGFFSVAYIICGETLMIDSVHSGYLRDCMVCSRSFIFLGVLIIYVGGQLLQEYYFSFLPLGVILLHGILLFFAPESPVHLYRKNEKKAIKALIWYRGKINMTLELKSIKRNVDIRRVDPDSHKYMLYSKVVVKGILIVVGLMFFKVFTGYWACIFFNEMIWERYGGYYFDSYIDTLIYGCFLFVASVISTRVHYSIPFGVRKPLLISTAFVAINLGSIVVYCLLYEFEVQTIQIYAHWFPLLAVNLSVISYELGLSIIPETLIFDYMPYQVYPRAKTIVKSLHWFFVFLLVKLFSGISATLGRFSFSFLLNFTFAVIGIFYVYFFVVEVKDKPLVKIQLAIGGNPIGNRSIYRKQWASRT